jgi:hypothetical protein
MASARKNLTFAAKLVDNCIKDQTEMLVVQLVAGVLKPRCPKLFARTEITAQMPDATVISRFIFYGEKELAFLFELN